MEYYSIYLTEEIVKKALKIKCPLRKIVQQYRGQPPIYYTLPYKDTNWCYCDAYYIPTVEQICEWLNKEKNLQVFVQFRGSCWYYNIMSGSKILKIGDDVETRRDALLTGVDKVFDLLIENFNEAK